MGNILGDTGNPLQEGGQEEKGLMNRNQANILLVDGGLQVVAENTVRNWYLGMLDRAWPQGQNMPCAPTNHLCPTWYRVGA
jgi:hypothetical protein